MRKLSPGYYLISRIIRGGFGCEVINVGPDFVDLEFDDNGEGIRRVRMLLNDGIDAASSLPNGIAFGRAISIHKAQGSQFKAVIIPTERGNDRYGNVQRAIIYTGASRAIDRLIIVGSFADFVNAATTPDFPRNTLLRDLLTAGVGIGGDTP